MGEFEEIGPLKLAGYTVGASGALSKKRHEILEDFVCAFPIPQNVFARDYLKPWGSPLSVERKNQTERAIQRFITINGSRSTMTSAVGDWKADLRWLKSTTIRQGCLVVRVKVGRK